MYLKTYLKILLSLLQGYHLPEHVRFPDFSTRAGKNSLIYCLMLWLTLDSH